MISKNENERYTIGVIIPLYKQGMYLETCVTSVLRQTFKDFCVTIVDDCSPDDSGDIADKLALTDDRIRVIHLAKNMGLSAARNTGIEASHSKYILPLDADDAIASTMLEKCLERIEDGMGDIIYTDYQEFGESHNYINMSEYCYDMLKIRNHMVCCSLYHKSHWREVGGYDESMTAYEDWQFYLKMGYHGHYGYRIAEPLFAYRVKKHSMITEARKRHAELCKHMMETIPEVYKGVKI